MKQRSGNSPWGEATPENPIHAAKDCGTPVLLPSINSSKEGALWEEGQTGMGDGQSSSLPKQEGQWEKETSDNNDAIRKNKNETKQKNC